MTKTTTKKKRKLGLTTIIFLALILGCSLWSRTLLPGSG